MLGYALYGLITGSQSGFAAVDLGQTVFAYTVWLGLLTSVDGGEVKAEKAAEKYDFQQMLSWYGVRDRAWSGGSGKCCHEFGGRRYCEVCRQYDYGAGQCGRSF